MQTQTLKPMVMALAFTGLFGCGGGGGGDDIFAPSGSGGGASLASHMVYDPIDDTYNERFPSQPVTVLPSGNLVIVKSFEDNDNNAMGRVMVYNPVTREFIASFEDDQVLDRIGSGTNDGNDGITVLTNGNFVIHSPYDQVNGISQAGSVILVDGTTGEQIGDTIAGDNAQDHMGGSPSEERDTVIPLSNGNFVLISIDDDVSGVTDAGSVALYSGTTGAQIGATFAGDDALDRFGKGGVIELTNGNLVIASYYDTTGVASGGSVILVDGTTGTQLGSTLEGDTADDRLGSGGVTALTNGNYVVASPYDDVAAVTNAGSVRLMNGTTGAEIEVISGDNSGDQIGNQVVALTNGNFAAGSYVDDVSALADAGSIRLYNGSNGVEIGAGFVGDHAGDWISLRAVALTNGNLLIGSSSDDIGAGPTVNAGSVQLIDGSTGVQIGASIVGDAEGDQIGNDLEALADGNAVIGTQYDNNDTFGVTDSGSVMMINGTTGSLITTIQGNDNSDRMGSVTPFGSNFMVVAPFDDVTPPAEATRTDAGSVAFYGALGIQLGETQIGSQTDATLSASAITGSDTLVVSKVDNGFIEVYDTTDGSVPLSLTETTAGDFTSISVVAAEDGSLFAVGLPYFDRDAAVDEGAVQVIVPE